MIRKSLLLTVLLIFFPIFVIYAQEEAITEDETEAVAKPAAEKSDFWICVGGETSFYNASGLTFSGSLALGYGSGSSMGLKGSFFYNGDVSIIEFDLLLRFYMYGKKAYFGPFFQFLGGASLINYQGEFNIPASTGIINAGLGFGWRFLYFNRFFVEPAIRLGYPYFLGLGVSAGIRF